MSERNLVRALSLTSATALVIGSIIGTGVFFKATVMAQAVGSPALVLVAWVAAGLLSLGGALTYAELGAMMPHAGGEYVYLRTAYGDGAAFLCGWMRLVVGTAGVAALAVGFATFLSAVVPMHMVWAAHSFRLLDRSVDWQFGLKEAVAFAVIVVFGGMNCMGVRFGGRMQVALSVAKVAGILGIAVGAFLFSDHYERPGALLSAEGQSGGIQGFGAAMLAALWAYDGWAYMPMVAGEVKHPARNVPRALFTGTVAVLVLYCLVNLAYFCALPFSDVAQSHSTAHPAALPVAARAAQSFLGARGPRIASLLFMLSAVGALNGVIMSTARMPYAMARDRLFFASMGRLNRANVPAVVVFWLTLWSALLAVSGSFDRLTDMAVFGMWSFYVLTACAVFVLRRKMPDAPRPYRAFGYPVMPALFVLVGIWLLCNSLVTSRIESIAGLVLILAGWPFYRWFRRAKAAAPKPDHPAIVSGDSAG